ncbi:response regulator [Hufsiella ginkgonis]|uniref:Response regulator n=1 Tax=Hufsiella ginkgonis TaxID=2695274 RepID=A0A7K1XSF6_9SPHI|nr:response regulator [Hufsiella ginkgonis]MXV13941.1 response regulator [Hufsiella ginkgonis]
MAYRHKTVLLVDDSYLDNLISRKILEKSNYAENIVVIDSPQRAVAYIENSIKVKKDIPEIIFLDIRMPEMNGFDFLRKINVIEGIAKHEIKIYMLSSSLDPNDLKKIEENQLVSKFIGKPLTNEILEEI